MLFLHLEPDHFAGTADFSHIKTAYALHSDQFVFDKGLQGVVSVEFLSAAVIERYFYDPAGAFGVMKG
jgi:hypothetical protein